MTREKAIKAITAFVENYAYGSDLDGLRDAIEALKEQRPHGEWIEKPWGVVCSRCKAQALHTPNGNQSRSDYCPDCGALMRKEGDENG